MSAIEVLIRPMIDYAGFPPAALPFQQAANCREYQRHKRADFLGSLVAPLDSSAAAARRSPSNPRIAVHAIGSC